MLEAEFVSKIVQQGIPKTVAPSLASMRARTAGMRMFSGARAVKGVMKKIIGRRMAEYLKHVRTP
jgi:hypothetical protein